jgi:hypothetical protein
VGCIREERVDTLFQVLFLFLFHGVTSKSCNL